MKRLLMAGALAFAVAAGQALAADLPQPAPPPQAPVAYVPTVAPVYNWGGIYFGANGGYGFGSSEWSDPNNPSSPCTTGNFSTTGFLVGPTVGVNFQTDAFVFGIEGDFDASWLDGKSSSAYCGAVLASALPRNAKPRIPGWHSPRPRWLCGGSRAVLWHCRRRVRQYRGRRKRRFREFDQVRAGPPAPASRWLSPTTGRLGSNTYSSTSKMPPAAQPILAAWILLPPASRRTRPSNSTPT